ncbi:hypothetical protein [Candidatus Formimonas warabiya]|uniref:Uncharacterized protein n=1 Tax=Formimonas warabiya TaxID=1761012 RepID=A0A3G1L127_FORW1|nr:hypothetical protein [Candidatus Formimonas warabiya]ATW28185.1 hypothetical protein DCMF_28570 [Candidatus Formimonas warabiya]
MDLKPVKKYHTPRYPEKSLVLDKPALLKTLPERWKGNAYIGMALTSVLAFSLAGCTASSQDDKTISRNQPGKVTAAPIFEHGQGRGSFGCVSVAPPSFLSEEEAYDVIQEEAEKYGIVFERDAFELKGVEIPETKYYLKPEGESQEFSQRGEEIDSTRRGDLSLDGYDESRKIGFEFVSREDYEQWSKEQTIRSSVDDFDFSSTAKMLRQGTDGKNGEVHLGIFYNPMTPYQELKELGLEQDDFEAMKLKTKEMAAEELKKQVKDFLDWLKAQGII